MQITRYFCLFLLLLFLKKLPTGKHKSELTQAENINDLLLLDSRPHRPRLCRKEFQEQPELQSRGVWETKAAPKAPNQPKQPKQQRKRRAPKAPKEQKEKKMKEDDELQKKIEQQARQIEELQRLHQQTNQKLLNPNDTQAQANNDLWFDKGAKQQKESIEWGLALTKQMNREAAELEAERAKLQHKNYMEITSGRLPAETPRLPAQTPQNPTLFPPQNPTLFPPQALMQAPAPAALMLAAAAHAPAADATAAHAPAAHAPAAPATAAPAAATPAEGNVAAHIATLAALLVTGDITQAEFAQLKASLLPPS